MADLKSIFLKSPVIAAVRDREQFLRAVCSPVQVIFFLGGDLFTLPEWVATAMGKGKLPFIHMDLVDGIGKDNAAVRWVARTFRPAGVLSTRGPLIKTASDEGLCTVLRMFLVDSSSMETGIRMVKASSPDFVEVMPGLVTRAIARLGQRIMSPVIAGGMLENEKDVEAALASGAIAASTSSEDLWAWEGR